MLNSASRLWAGIDVRAVGGVTLPPSRHASGKRYEWVDYYEEIRPFPMAALLALNPQRPAYREPARADLGRIAAQVKGAPDGQRNDLLNRAAFTCGGLIAVGRLTYDEAYAALDEAAAEAGLLPWERRATIKSGLRGGLQHPMEQRRS